MCIYKENFSNKSSNLHNAKTIGALLKMCSAQLSPHVHTHALEARVLVGHALAMSEKDLILHHEQQVHKTTHDKICSYVEQRIRGIPLAYITGHKEFYGRNFFVNSDVLIPRVETELLVEEVLSYAKKNLQTILDVGTGSGCIGITLAAELRNLHEENLQDTEKQYKVLLSDTSTRALSLAKKNALEILGMEHVKKFIRLYHWDVGAPLENMKPFMHNEIYGRDEIHIIVANLPYVAPHQYEYAYRNLPHEPYAALVGDSNDNTADGFFFIRTLLRTTAQFRHTHCLVLECDPLQIDMILHEASVSRYKSVRIIHDIRGYPRACYLQA